MGDTVLKIVLCTLMMILSYAQTSYPEIDILIQKIKQKRIGLPFSRISHIKDPFMHKKKGIDHEKTLIKRKKQTSHHYAKKERLDLTSIFNDRAKINGKWYHKGERIGPYLILSINPVQGKVIIRSKKKTLQLLISTHTKNFIRIHNNRRVQQ